MYEFYKPIPDVLFEKIIIKKKKIILIAEDESPKTIKRIVKLNMRGIFCRNGHVLDTVNGVVTKIKDTDSFDYKIPFYRVGPTKLDGKIDYDRFSNFVVYHKFFKDTYKTSLLWDNKIKSSQMLVENHWDVTDSMIMVPGITDKYNPFAPHIKIIANPDFLNKIKLKSNLGDTLYTFLDEIRICTGAFNNMHMAKDIKKLVVSLEGKGIPTTLEYYDDEDEKYKEQKISHNQLIKQKKVKSWQLIK